MNDVKNPENFKDSCVTTDFKTKKTLNPCTALEKAVSKGRLQITNMLSFSGNTRIEYYQVGSISVNYIGSSFNHCPYCGMKFGSRP